MDTALTSENVTYVPPAQTNIIQASSTQLLSIILPTRNEAQNIRPLLARIAQATQGMPVEIIFIDDSNDDTPKVIQNCADTLPLNIRLIARAPGQRSGGLGGAVVTGMKAAQGFWVCVMDADLQHPPEMIPKMVQHAQTTGTNIVIGSRFVDGSSTPGLNQMRTAISGTLILSARILFLDRLGQVKDPLTGFFLVQRSQIDLTKLRPNGFKILLEIIVQFPKLTLSELGFEMEARQHGDSKASMQEVMRYFRKLLELRLTSGNPRFLYFLAVGLSGLLVNNGALALFAEIFHVHYLASAILATQISTLWNFLLTEFWVFGDRRAPQSFWKRFIGFALINNALLIVRGPMITGLVEGVHLHYVLANLISIGAATIGRYFLADKFLWASKDPAKKADSITDLSTLSTSLPTNAEAMPVGQPVQPS